jgi:pyridoxine 4-dehydrogenase
MSSKPAAAAGTVALGDLAVSRMGFGARWISVAGADAAGTLLHRALDLGINLIDTADVYGGGLSEQLIAEALHPYPDDLVIATKGGQTVVDEQPVPNGRPEYLRRACEASLERLRLERIDVYQLHSPDPDVPIEESLGALAELRAEGKIRHIGGSNLFAHFLDAAFEAVELVSVQNQFSFTRRRSEREVENCEQRGIAFMPWRPLAGGSLAERDLELDQIAAAHGATRAQVALAWLLHRSPVMVPIPGTASLSHLEENVGAAELQLTGDELRRLADLPA